jgi:hypothetical protein
LRSRSAGADPDRRSGHNSNTCDRPPRVPRDPAGRPTVRSLAAPREPRPRLPFVRRTPAGKRKRIVRSRWPLTE